MHRVSQKPRPGAAGVAGDHAHTHARSPGSRTKACPARRWACRHQQRLAASPRAVASSPSPPPRPPPVPAAARAAMQPSSSDRSARCHALLGSSCWSSRNSPWRTGRAHLRDSRARSPQHAIRHARQNSTAADTLERMHEITELAASTQSITRPAEPAIFASLARVQACTYQLGVYTPLAYNPCAEDPYARSSRRTHQNEHPSTGRVNAEARGPFRPSAPAMRFTSPRRRAVAC